MISISHTWAYHCHTSHQYCLFSPTPQVTDVMTIHAFQGAWHGNAALVHWALELGGATVEGNDRLLVIGAEAGHYEVCEAIVKLAQTSVDDEEGHHGRRALAVATMSGHNKVVKLLLRHNAHPDAQVGFQMCVSVCL